MSIETDLTLYETIFILRPEHGPKAREYIDKCKKIVEDHHGTVTYVEEWGNREMAYPIQKQSRGNYTLMRYRSPGGTVEELERTLKLSEEVMRCMTVCLDKELDIPSPQAPKVPQSPPQPAASSKENDSNDSEVGS